MAIFVSLFLSEEQGIGYVETSNLDGETNLKIRQAHPQTAHLTAENIVSEEWTLGVTVARPWSCCVSPMLLQSQCSGWRVECEGPNNRLYDFTGNIHK